MLVNRLLYERILDHALCAIQETPAQSQPFAHISVSGVFPADVYQRLLENYPPETCYIKANPKHHSNEYGGSTRQRMKFCEASFALLSNEAHTLWATVRAAVSSQPFRDAIFGKLAAGLSRRFRLSTAQLSQISAFPRGQMYRETEGYAIAPHPDTREKVVTMQFAFPHDDSSKHVGTEFYAPSLNPLHLLRAPHGFIVAKTMPFLPNHAYAFAVLNEVGLKSWHGRCTIPPMQAVRNSLLHIWYDEPDETHAELEAYQNFLHGGSVQDHTNLGRVLAATG